MSMPGHADEPAGRADARLARLSWRQAVGIGTAQAIALIAGF